MRVLYVCTANICRSASAQALLRESLAAAPELEGVQVLSAGTDAIPGAQGCPVAPALAGHAQEHHSQSLTAELVAWADLILPAARDHRPAIVALAPASRSRTFTIRQAGRIADWLVEAGMVDAARQRAGTVFGESTGAVEESTIPPAVPNASPSDPDRPIETTAWADRFAPGDPCRDVEPLPGDPAHVSRWLIAEMDAARGVTVLPSHEGAAPTRPRRSLRRRRPAPPAGWPSDDGTPELQGDRMLDPAADIPGAHPDDIADPHVLGMGLHPLAYQQIRSSTDSLTRLLLEVGRPVGGSDLT